MDSPMELAAKRLAWDVETRKSVEVHGRTEIVKHGDGPPSPDSFDFYTEHYIETAAGQRFCDFRGYNQGKVLLRSAHFGDGSRFVDISYDRENPEIQKTIHINKSFRMEGRSDRKQLPDPLLFLYAGREPLHEALPKARYLGQGEVMGRVCNIFMFENVHWPRVQDQVFYLDQETSIPLKVEAFKDQASRDKNGPTFVWTAQSLDQVQGHFVTLKSTSTVYREGGAPRLTWKFNAESMEFNKDYPASTFRPTFEPGAVIIDATTEKVPTVPGAKPETKDATSEATTTAEPIRATPPWDWSSVASNTALGLGFAIVIVAGLLWWRRR